MPQLSGSHLPLGQPGQSGGIGTTREAVNSQLGPGWPWASTSKLPTNGILCPVNSSSAGV